MTDGVARVGVERIGAAARKGSFGRVAPLATVRPSKRERNRLPKIFRIAQCGTVPAPFNWNVRDDPLPIAIELPSLMGLGKKIVMPC